MQSAQIAFLVIVFMVILTMGGVCAYAYFKLSKKEEKQNLPILFNLDSRHSNGRALSVIIKEEIGVNGRKKITINPRDVDVDKQIEEEENSIISNNIIEFPRGSLSNDREIKINLPINSEDLTEGIQNSVLGKTLSKFIEKKDEEHNTISAIREARNRQNVINLALGGGELSNAQIARLNEMLEAVSDTIKKDKREGGMYPGPHT